MGPYDGIILPQQLSTHSSSIDHAIASTLPGIMRPRNQGMREREGSSFRGDGREHEGSPAFQRHLRKRCHRARAGEGEGTPFLERGERRVSAKDYRWTEANARSQAGGIFLKSEGCFLSGREGIVDMHGQ